MPGDAGIAPWSFGDAGATLLLLWKYLVTLLLLLWKYRVTILLGLRYASSQPTVLEQVGKKMNTYRQLVAVIDSDFDDEIASHFQLFVDSLKSQQWNNGAPRFFDEVDEDGCTRPEDIPVRSVGCVIYFPTNAKRERNIEQTSYADVSLLISLLEKYTKNNAVEIIIELDDDYIGEIVGGKANRGISFGLLTTWLTSIS